MTELNYKRKATSAAAITLGAFLLFVGPAKAQSSFSPPDLTRDGVVINKAPPPLPLRTGGPSAMSGGPPRGVPAGHQVSLIPGSSLDMTTPPPLTTPNLEIMSVPTPRLSTGEDIKQAVANINKIKHEENMRRAAAEEALKESFGFQPGMAGATPRKPPAKEPETKMEADNHVASGPPPLPCQDDNGDMHATLAQCSKEMRVINSANLMLQSAPRGYVSAENLQEMTPITTSLNGKGGDGVECVVSSLTSAGASMTHFKAEDVRECISASTHMTYQMPGVSNIVILGANIGEIKISCRRPPPDGIQIECAKE